MALKSGRVGIHPSQVDPITGMLIGGTGGASIDDTTIASDKTWSSQKINTELNNKQDTLTAGSNITIENDVISSTASGGASIDDTSISTETTWSSNKINSELSGKQGTLTAGSNITIENDVISSTASGGLLPELQITATTGSTVTATKGSTVITATEISSGLFTCEVPEFGTYTVSDGTDSTTVTVDTVKIYEVEIIPTPSVISVTLTLYSATEDQVTVVDEDGTHLEQFASGQSSKSITVKVLAGGSNVTFISSIAKNPSDLSEYYSKTVTITSATTEAYCMPDNALYWYGCDTGELETINTANGWNISGQTVTTPIFNTNDIQLSGSGIGTKTTKSTSKVSIIVTATSTSTMGGCSSKIAFDSSSLEIKNVYSANNPTLIQSSPETLGNYYLEAYCVSSVTDHIYAFWYE